MPLDELLLPTCSPLQGHDCSGPSKGLEKSDRIALGTVPPFPVDSDELAAQSVMMPVDGASDEATPANVTLSTALAGLRQVASPCEAKPTSKPERAEDPYKMSFPEEKKYKAVNERKTRCCNVGCLQMRARVLLFFTFVATKFDYKSCILSIAYEYRIYLFLPVYGNRIF